MVSWPHDTVTHDTARRGHRGAAGRARGGGGRRRRQRAHAAWQTHLHVRPVAGLAPPRHRRLLLGHPRAPGGRQAAERRPAARQRAAPAARQGEAPDNAGAGRRGARCRPRGTPAPRDAPVTPLQPPLTSPGARARERAPPAARAGRRQRIRQAGGRRTRTGSFPSPRPPHPPATRGPHEAEATRARVSPPSARRASSFGARGGREPRREPPLPP